MSKLHKGKARVCLVAVDVRSAHNIGSLFRTCDGFAAELFLVGICPRPIGQNDSRLPHIAQKAQKDISKTALGAEQTVTWRYAVDLDSCIEILKHEGFKVLAIEQDVASADIRSLNETGSIALVVGREVEGLSQHEIQLCDDVYEIGMLGKKESFNVSVAAAIGLYQARASFRAIES